MSDPSMNFGMIAQTSTRNHGRMSLGLITIKTRRYGRPAEYRWRPLFNAAKFG